MRSICTLAACALLAIGLAGKAGAEALPFTGTFEFHWGALPSVSVPGSGAASVSITGGNHLASLALPAGFFGPITASLPVTSNPTINSIIFTGMVPAAGTPIVAGGGAAMGLTGTAKICLVFAPCQYANTFIPLTGWLGVAGTQAIPGAVAVTMQHNPWTLGHPTMTIHTPNSNVTTPVLPGGFAHGPATLTSSTVQEGGPLQMVTVTKAFTSLTGAFPEMPVYAVLTLAFPAPGCRDGADSDGDGLIDWPDDPGCDDAEDWTEQSTALVCDNGLDDDGDTLVDVAEDPGCDHPTDPSEQNAVIACDDGSDNDGDALSDYPDDPGCDDAGDPSEKSPLLACDDGIDNDHDGRTDFDPVTFANPGDQTTPPSGTGDPGCRNPTWSTENPKCQDGINNDGKPGIDFDGGASVNGGIPIDEPDPQCVDKPWRNGEGAGGCGLGVELALLVPPLMWLSWRRSRTV